MVYHRIHSSCLSKQNVTFGGNKYTEKAEAKMGRPIFSLGEQKNKQEQASNSVIKEILVSKVAGKYSFNLYFQKKVYVGCIISSMYLG